MPPQIQATAVEVGLVAADGAIRQRDRAPWVVIGPRGQPAAALKGEVAANGAVGQRGRAVVEQTTAPLPVGIAADLAVDDRHARYRRRDIRVDQEYSAVTTAADRHARRRARDRLGPRRVAQFELAGGQGDLLWRREGGRVEGDVIGACWALAPRIAWRSEPGPLSSVLLTRKVDRRVRSSMRSKQGRWRNRTPTNPPGNRCSRRRRHGESVRD